MERICVEIEKMVCGGDCIAKYEGKTVFIPYAIPGEKVEIEITEDCKDFYRAKIVDIIEKSEHRVKPQCTLYGKCGGCNLMHIDYEFQKELKCEILKNAFEREGINLEKIDIICGNEKNYRSRFQFHDGGLMMKQSNNIIPVENCLCACEEINKYLEEVPFEQREKGRVQIFGSEKISSIPVGFDKIIVAKETEMERVRNERKNYEAKSRTVNGRKLKKTKPIKKMYAGSTQSQENFCTVNICGKNVSFDVQGFFQSNLEVLEKCIPYITEGLEGKNVLDMYSGCGTFSVFLTDKFEKVCLVEHNKAAIVYAEQNLAGTKHESYGLSGEVWTKYHAENYIKQNGNFDAVVIDPPRSGMEKEVCMWLQKSNIPQIRSLSCDIATHARDAKFLIRSGYKLEKIYLLDFYPHTGHIESLAYFTKENETD